MEEVGQKIGARKEEILNMRKKKKKMKFRYKLSWIFLIPQCISQQLLCK